MLRHKCKIALLCVMGLSAFFAFQAPIASAGIPSGLTSAQMLDYVLKYPAATRNGAPAYWWQSGLNADQLGGLAASKTRLETYVSAYGSRSYAQQVNSLRILYPLTRMRGEVSDVQSWPVTLATDIASQSPISPGLAIALDVGAPGAAHYAHVYAFGLGAGSGSDPDGAGPLVGATYRWRHFTDICTAVVGAYGFAFNPANWCSNGYWANHPSSSTGGGWVLEFPSDSGAVEGLTCSGNASYGAAIATINSQTYVDGYDLKNRYANLLPHLNYAYDVATNYPCPSPGGGSKVFNAAWLSDEQMAMQFGEYATEDNAAGGGAPVTDRGFLASTITVTSYDNTITYGCGVDQYCKDFFKYVTLQTDTPPDGGTVPAPPTASCFTIPAPTDRNEQATAYEADLAALGWTGTPTVNVLTDSQKDPTRGPSAVVTTDPAIGQCLLFASPISIWVNPSTLTVVPPGGGGGGGSGIDFGPINRLHTSCTAFPFGLFCYLSSALGWFNVAPVTPSFDITFDAPGFVYHNGSSSWIDPWHTDIGFHPIHYAGSLSAFDPYMSIVRTLESIALWIGGLWWIANKLWLGGDSDLVSAVDDGSPDL